MNPDTNLCHQQQELPLPDQLQRQHFQFINAQLNKNNEDSTAWYAEGWDIKLLDK